MRRTYVAPLSNEDRLRVDFETERGQVTVLHVVQYETMRHGEWHPVARYDTAHGFLHLDLQTQSGQVKYQVLIQDLSDALTSAIDDLKASWPVYKRQFHGNP
jgi:hypothetical protein